MKRSVKLIRKKPAMHWVGDGFPVYGIFGYNDLGQDISPFLMMDYAAPYQFSPSHEKRGVGAHPHKGFETVTLAYQGEVSHRDSSGGGGTIAAGDVQWMTAASGVVHEEFHSEEFTKNGGMFQMVQLWVNLPAKDKKAPPAYQTIVKANIPSVSLADGNANIRVVAGELLEHRGAAKTFTPINLWDGYMKAGSSVSLPIPASHNCCLFLLDGNMNVDERRVTDADFVVYQKDGDTLDLTALENTRFLVLTGEPINEPIVGYGPFVMNTRAEILEAYEQFQSGKMGDL